MNHRDLSQLDTLFPLPSATAQRLAAEIRALREAQEAVTSEATTAVIYGRLDHLVQERQRALYDEYHGQCRALTRDEQLAEVHTRG